MSQSILWPWQLYADLSTAPSCVGLRNSTTESLPPPELALACAVAVGVPVLSELHGEGDLEPARPRPPVDGAMEGYTVEGLHGKKNKKKRK